MRILNAMELSDPKRKKEIRNSTGVLTQPLQFIPSKEKNINWLSDVIDWYELQGLEQIKRNSRRLLKNYKLAKGLIDKTDYILEEENEYADIVDVLTKEDESALELKFYPIIPNVINTLTDEFSKRVSKLTFRAVDDLSYNEMLEEKRAMLEEVLIQEAQQKMLIQMVNAGADLQGEEAQAQLNPENLKTLPEIERFFNKSYRNIYEEWASHQQKVDEQRFGLPELEARAFRDSLIADREFWHFKMGEDDYEVELWNPLTTFYHKSPEVRYISQGNYVGKVDLVTPSDAIDAYGWMMTEEQLRALETYYPVKNINYAMSGLQNDGSFYDSSKSHAWNTEQPSLGMRQYNAMYDFKGTGDIIEEIMSHSEDMFDTPDRNLLRVTTLYFKTQRKIGHLTKITEDADIIQTIVSEDYVVTDKPIYDTITYKTKTKDNLLFGEHIDWIWINETYGGIKIGPNKSMKWYGEREQGLEPMYLGLKGGLPGRIPFQFKGDHTLYGCKLPVEGAVFSDRNTKSVSLVDLMKPFQIGYNIVNNQIADILIDELGTVILFDQNALPRHSMGEDWGKGNLQQMYLAMKNFQMAPLDTSIQNTESSLGFQHYQTLNLEQTNRLASRVNLANYFKSQAFEVIGINPERMGQQLSQGTATGVTQAIEASYAQTEVYFTQHSDYLMPRVHQMRTDLAQYYHSTKPSIRLQYLTQSDEKINFQMNGTNLLLRDLNIYCTTDNNSRSVMEQLRNLALNNNTSGASIYDLGNVIKAESIAELTNVLQAAEQKVEKIRQEEMAHQEKISKELAESNERVEQAKIAFEQTENEKDRQKDIIVAQIRAAQNSAREDLNNNAQSDYMDVLDRVEKQQSFQDQMNLKREQEVNKTTQSQIKNQLEREKIQAQREMKEKDLAIARENKTRDELIAAKKIKPSQK